MIIATDVDMEALIEEMHFSWCLGGDNLMDPKMCIPLKRMWGILGKYIPEMEEFFKTFNLELDADIAIKHS
jgi:hypothetical protein